MTPQFDSVENSRKLSSDDSQAARIPDRPDRAMGAIDMLKRDRFELLSAYLDGEVTASERKQVEEWLDSDPVVQRLYARLLKLRQGFQMIPAAPASQSTEQMVDAVFSRLDRRPKRAFVLWGGAAIAAVFVGAVSGILSGGGSLVPRFADSNPPQPTAASIRIALDRPVVNIPKNP